MRIASVTEDSVHISRHFGRAPYYTVVTLDDAGETARERRTKQGHRHGQGHGHGEAGQRNHDHAPMFSSIRDCQVLVAGGIGMPALTSAKASGLQVILTSLSTIDSALQAFMSGGLDHEPGLAHQPHRHHHSSPPGSS